MSDDEELLEIAASAARSAGAMLRDSRPAHLGVAATKSSPTDVVTEMDLAAERLIAEMVLARRPDDGFLGEENASTGYGGDGSSGLRWVVDPLDGTVNYLYGLPSWAVSIAVERDGRTLVAVVEVPNRGETFTAVRGGGAHRNGERISCRTGAPLAESLVGTGFGYQVPRRTAQAEVARRLLPRIRDIRRAGSAAIDLCDVACGRLDAFFERGLNPWDYAAGGLIAAEAGALVGGRPGGPPTPDLAVAAVPAIFDELSELLEGLGAWHD